MKITNQSGVGATSERPIDLDAERADFQQKLMSSMVGTDDPNLMIERLRAAMDSPTSEGLRLRDLPIEIQQMIANSRSELINQMGRTLAAEGSAIPAAFAAAVGVPGADLDLPEASTVESVPQGPGGADDFDRGATADDVQGMKDLMSGKNR